MTPTFEEINGKIQEFIAAERTDFYGLQDKDFKLPLSDAIFCATDIPRNRAFFRAIAAAVTNLQQKTENIHLVYAGSGTGILGIFALALGVNDATFIEHNPYSLAFSQKLSDSFDLRRRINFVEGDATKISLPRKYDLLISETLTSGFVREEFPAIVNHLRQFGNPQAIILPEKFLVTMKEKNSAGALEAVQNFEFLSTDGFSSQNIFLQNKETRQITWKTTSVLFGDITLSSGDCISYLNEMTQPIIGFSHPLFQLSQ